MDDHTAQWVGLVLRWVHVVTGIAWIGTSFYFNWLNHHLRAPEQAESGVGGELWSVHGGGFYRVVKYTVAPARLPRTLHWFKWEAYSTWLSGFALLVLIYWIGARLYTVDRAVADIPVLRAVAISATTLVGAWLVYDRLCRSFLGRHPAALTAVLAVLITVLAFTLTRVFSAHAAYLHVGAALGTIMAANVWRVIIPSQRAMVDAMAAGREPDAARGKQGALRSLHNNYFTLPVVFVMISGHFPATYGSSANWLVLMALFAAGVATRHWFNVHHQGRRGMWLLPAAALTMIALWFVTIPKQRSAAAAAESGLFAEARVVVARRCTPCHSTAPTQPGVPAAPNGVVLDTPEQMQAWAGRIAERAVRARTMPLGNVTGMTDEERALLGRWVAAGAELR